MWPRIPWPPNLDQPGGLHDWVLDNYCADFVSGLWEYVLYTGDTSLAPKLKNIDVSEDVNGHSGYQTNVTLL